MCVQECVCVCVCVCVFVCVVSSPGQYCNLSPLNHAMAGSVATPKLVKAIILISGVTDEPNTL